jgi:hypothetical protein
MASTSIPRRWLARLIKHPKRSTPSAKVKISEDSVAEPPSIKWLLEHRNHEEPRTPGNSLLASLYRMFESIVLDNNISLRNEVESFFNYPDWAVSAIPDPKDPDPARYAILSVIPSLLVVAFNRLIERGLPRGSPAILSDEELDELQSRPAILEEAPKWTANVARLREPLIIPDSNNEEPPEELRSPQFLKMNVIVAEPHVLFV